MSGTIQIETGVSGDDQMSGMMNAALHVGPNDIAVSIDAEAAFPEGVTTEAQMKAYLQEELKPLMQKGWNFSIQIGPDQG